MQGKKIIFIINPVSGSGNSTGLDQIINEWATARSFFIAIFYTTHRGHATELAKQAVAQQATIVFAVGGDGTVHETALGLLGSNTALGILPRGSGNGLARHLNIPINIARALSALNLDKVLMMDVLYINGKPMVNVSGIGYDAHVAQLFNRAARRGLWGYTKIVLREFVRFREWQCEIKKDDNHTERVPAWLVAIANSSQYGNNARIAPQASIHDGLIHLTVLRKPAVWQIPALFYRMFTGSVHQSSLVKTESGTAFTIKTDHAMALHIDGESSDDVATAFHITLQPNALKIISR